MAGERKGFRSRSKALEMKKIWGLLLLSLGSLLLVGVLFLGIRLWLTNRPFVLYPQVNPLLAFSPKELEPSIALLPLAGYDYLQVFRKALEEGELETAYVTLAFSTSLEDQERLGGWISLAQTFAEKGLRRKALISYGQAYNVAILNPYFSDLERAEALIAIGKGLERMGEKERAAFVLRQAEALVRSSPYLKKAQRIALAQRLGKDINPDEFNSESAQPAPLSKDFATLPESYYNPKERERLAQTLASSPTKKSLQALREALKSEDSARLALYKEKMSSEESLPRKAGWLSEKIAWLTLKYRIAMGGFGLSLVPEWEVDAPNIKKELANSYSELFAIYAEQAVSLPESSQAERAWSEIAALKAYYALIGLYPDAPMDKIVAEVKESHTPKLIFLDSSRTFAYEAETE
jgi:hypothetical protein